MQVILSQDQSRVLLTEKPGQKVLYELMNQLDSFGDINLFSEDSHMAIQCNANGGVSSCLFSFQKSKEVAMDKLKTFVLSTSVNTKSFRMKRPFIQAFENERGETFKILMDSNQFKVLIMAKPY